MVRIGIVGTGRIATRFVDEIVYVEGCAAELVYNPHIESAKRFAEKYGIPKAADRWAAFIDEIDAVYIASPHDTHYGYAKKALLAGKHVLCEKPLTLRRAELEELLEIAAERQLVLMEALKTAYCPGYREVIQVAKSGAIGRICSVEAAFTRLTASDTREFEDTENGGSFTEFGSYGLLPVLELLGTDIREVQFTSITNAEGVDGYTRMNLIYRESDDREVIAEASIKTGLSVKSEGQLVIAGTEGYILVPSPWWLTKYFEVRFEDPNRREIHRAEFAGAGLRYEISAFAEKVREGNDCENWEQEKKKMICRAKIFGNFLQQSRRKALNITEEEKRKIKIWAHRGCSMNFPENTLPAFEAAAMLPGITGLELDVQYTKDGEIVVFHDETVDRVTDGHGRVVDHTWKELQELHFKEDGKAPGRRKESAERYGCGEIYRKIIEKYGRDKTSENPFAMDISGLRIPSFRQVLETLKPYCEENGFLINVELKTGSIRYAGIEQECYDLVQEMGLAQNIVWSSFLPDSIRLIKTIDPEAETGMLDSSMRSCRKKGDAVDCDDYHPGIGGFADLKRKELKSLSGRVIRAWNSEEPLYNSGRLLKDKDLRECGRFGVTDVIVNVPERYLMKKSWRYRK